MKEVLTLSLVILISATATDGFARTWYVLPDSTGDAATIDAGCDSAAVGDTILVACGTYYEVAIGVQPGAVLRSETGTPDSVTIDAQAAGPVLRFIGGDSTTVVSNAFVHEPFTIFDSRFPARPGF